MHSIDNSSVINYLPLQNILATSVAFAYTGGSGYNTPPVVSFSGGGGSGAAGTAVLTNGRVSGITITAGGTGYTSAPAIAFNNTGTGGTGAAATALLTSTAVSGATITVGGTGKTITVTDNTVYPSGDSRATVTITVADKFGTHKEYNIGVSPNNVTIDLLADGFNDIYDIVMAATVASTKRHYKDGSIFGVGPGKPSGNFIMEI